MRRKEYTVTYPICMKKYVKKTDIKEILGGILGVVVLVAIVYGAVAIWG